MSSSALDMVDVEKSLGAFCLSDLSERDERDRDDCLADNLMMGCMIESISDERVIECICGEMCFSAAK